MDRTLKPVTFTCLMALATGCQMGALDSHHYAGAIAVDSQDYGFYMKTKRDGDVLPSFCLASNCGSNSSFGYHQLYLTTVEGDELIEGEKFGPKIEHELRLPGYSHIEGFFLFAGGAGRDVPEIHRLDGSVDVLIDLAGDGGDPLLSRDGTMVAKVLGTPRDGGKVVFVDTRSLEVLLVHSSEYSYQYGWDEQGRFWIRSENESPILAIVPRTGELSESSPPCFVGQTSGGQYRASDQKYVSTGDHLPLKFVDDPDGEDGKCYFE